MFRYFFIIFAIYCQVTVAFSQVADIPKPHKFVGHKIGADKKLFSWQIIYDYLKILHEKSDRVILEELGQSTLGKPFVLLKISSPINIRNIAKYKNLQRQAAYPQNLTERDVAQLTREKKAIVMVIFNSSSHGIASVQGVLELAYHLATNQSRSVQNILDNIILLLVPDLNPDGLQKIVEWYNNYLATPHEGSPLPGLTHEYAGDEIYEDFLSLNLIETQMVASQVYRKWYPEVVISINETQQHPRILVETGATGYDTNIEESLWKLPGLALNLIDGQKDLPAFFKTANIHNQISFKISAAKTLFGTPLFFPTGSDATQKLPALLGPAWSGGWWTMRDIIDSEFASVLSVLDWASSNKEKIIENFCVKNIEFTENATGGISAYCILQKQHDPATLRSMLIFLTQNGVKIYHPEKTMRVGNQLVALSDYVIPRAQPVRQFIDYMFEQSGGTISLPARYGVEVIELKNAIDVELIELKYIRKEQAKSDFFQKGNYLISNTSNDAYAVINRFFNRKKRIYQFREKINVGGNAFLPGTLYIPKDEIKADEFESIIEGVTVDVQKINFDFKLQKAFRLHRPKIGIYQPWITTPDQGWTRLVLDQFGFYNEAIYGSKIRSGSLNHFDVIILPDMEADILISGWGNVSVNDFTPSMPRPYLDGITFLGIENLKKYVTEGGTLIALGQACRFVRKEFTLPIKETSWKPQANSSGLQQMVAIKTDNKNPIAFGMQEKIYAVFTNDFYLQPMPWQGKTEVVAHFANPVQVSNGQSNLYFKDKLPAVIKIPMGKGKIILMSVRPQFRGQVPATYKLLFNSILNASSEKVVL